MRRSTSSPTWLVKDPGVFCPLRRKAPILCSCTKLAQNWMFELCRCGGMVDATDLKSDDIREKRQSIATSLPNRTRFKHRVTTVEDCACHCVTILLFLASELPVNSKNGGCFQRLGIMSFTAGKLHVVDWEKVPLHYQRR